MGSANNCDDGKVCSCNFCQVNKTPNWIVTVAIAYWSLKFINLMSDIFVLGDMFLELNCQFLVYYLVNVNFLSKLLGAF